MRWSGRRRCEKYKGSGEMGRGVVRGIGDVVELEKVFERGLRQVAEWERELRRIWDVMEWKKELMRIRDVVEWKKIVRRTRDVTKSLETWKRGAVWRIR